MWSSTSRIYFCCGLSVACFVDTILHFLHINARRICAAHDERVHQDMHKRYGHPCDASCV